MKFWVLPEFAESLRGMVSSFNSSGVQETLLFLHWGITHPQDTVDLPEPRASNTAASAPLPQGRDNYITVYGDLFILLQKCTKQEDELLLGETRKRARGSRGLRQEPLASAGQRGEGERGGGFWAG